MLLQAASRTQIFEPIFQDLPLLTGIKKKITSLISTFKGKHILMEYLQTYVTNHNKSIPTGE